jgi:Family of unknown function (DUF5996)
MSQIVLPALPLDQWIDTRDTLQRYLQIAGKVRLALCPPEPEFANVSLALTSRGLTTGPMPYHDRSLQIDFDFIAHRVIITTSDGGIRSLDLTPKAVAAFHREIMSLLRELKCTVDCSPIPQEVADLTPFDQDTKHASYDAAAAHRFWQVLRWVDVVLKRYRAPFPGRQTAVQFFWGSFDLAYDRYSGKPAAPPPGANMLFRKSLDAELVYAGFWPGDARFPEPAFASYVYPKPTGIEQAQIRPSTAGWNTQLGEFILRYDDVRAATLPEAVLMEFLESTYDVSARLSGWDPALRA